MRQYKYLSAGTENVFPRTFIQALSSDNLPIGEGDPNETLKSLLDRVFTRIKNLEDLVAALTTQVNDLENQLASLQVPEITEHFTLYLYTYTADTNTYPSASEGTFFTIEGEVHDEDTLSSNGWFTTAQKAADACSVEAANAGSDKTPGIWGIKLEVSKRDGKYFIYPGIEDFKYDPQLTNGDALVTTFMQTIEDVKAELVDKIEGETSITSIRSKAGCPTDLLDASGYQSVADTATAINSSINTTVNDTVNDFLTTMGVTTTNITKWNDFDSLKESLEAEFIGDGFVNKLNDALTLRGFIAGDHDKLIEIHDKLSEVTDLNTYIDNRVSGISAKTILNKLANNTDNLTFTDGGVSKTRTAKARLNELLFGSDNDGVITADTYMLKTGLVRFKEAIAIDNILDTSNPEYNSFRNLVKQMVGLDSGNLVDVVANSAGSGGGVNMEALELAVMSDQDNAFKRALNRWKVSSLGMADMSATLDTWKTSAINKTYVRQMAGCLTVATTVDDSGYESVSSATSQSSVRSKVGLTIGLIKAANAYTDSEGRCMTDSQMPSIYTLDPVDSCGQIISRP